MRLNGFRGCTCLENATFFSDLKLQIDNDEFELTPSTASRVIRYIDSAAREIVNRPRWNQNIFQRRTQITEDYYEDLFMRSICFTVAHGILDREEWKGFVKRDSSRLEEKGMHGGRFLRTIDTDVALPFLNYYPAKSSKEKSWHNLGLPFHKHHVKQTFVKKPHYNLAYVLIVSDGTDNVMALIDALAHPTAFIYIHIDLAASADFRNRITDFVRDRPHIVIMPNPFSASWAHISLVWVEIRAYFDLLDRIDFDYVINLSDSDYPLKSAPAIYKNLERRSGSNWVWWLDDKPDQIKWRTEDMYHCQPPWRDGQAPHLTEAQKLTRCVWDVGSKMGQRPWTGLNELYPYRWKSAQWKILHRDTIEALRKSEAFKLLLIWGENMWVPDEMLFATWINTSPFADRTFRDPKRLIRWTAWAFPYRWTSSDEDLIMEWQQHFYFIRKVNVTGDPPLKDILDRIRKKDEMSDDLVVYYRDGITPVD